jgi:hypothetical protein
MILIPNLYVFSDEKNSAAMGFYSFLKEVLQLVDADCDVEFWRGRWGARLEVSYQRF